MSLTCCYFKTLHVNVLFFSRQNRNVVIFYGSQTGTAEEFSGRLAKEASRYGMKAIVADPEECEMVSIVFIVRLSILTKKSIIIVTHIFMYLKI